MKAIKIKMAFEPPHKRSPTFCVANIIGPVLLEHTLNKIQLLLVNSCQSIFLALKWGVKLLVIHLGSPLHQRQLQVLCHGQHHLGDQRQLQVCHGQHHLLDLVLGSLLQLLVCHGNGHYQAPHLHECAPVPSGTAKQTASRMSRQNSLATKQQHHCQANLTYLLKKPLDFTAW